MIKLDRRTLLSLVALGCTSSLAYKLAPSFKTDGHWTTLKTRSVSLGEWELVALDIKNGTILVIDPIKETILTKFEIGGKPSGLLHSGNGIVVGVDSTLRKITIIRNNVRLERLILSLDLIPSLVALSPNGSMLVVLDMVNGELAFLSAKNGKMLKQYSGLKTANNILFNKSGDFLFISKRDSPKLLSFNTHTFEKSLSFGIKGSEGIERLLPLSSNDGAVALAFRQEKQSIHFLNLERGIIERSTNLTTNASDIIVNSRGSRVFVLSESNPEIYQFSAFSNFQTKMDTDNIGDIMMLDDVLQRLSVLNTKNARLDLFDIKTNLAQKKILLPGSPVTGIFHKWSRKTFVAIHKSQKLWLLDSEGEVRQIDTQGYEPSLFAAAGQGICHA